MGARSPPQRKRRGIISLLTRLRWDSLEVSSSIRRKRPGKTSIRMTGGRPAMMRVETQLNRMVQHSLDNRRRSGNVSLRTAQRQVASRVAVGKRSAMKESQSVRSGLPPPNSRYPPQWFFAAVKDNRDWRFIYCRCRVVCVDIRICACLCCSCTS